MKLDLAIHIPAVLAPLAWLLMPTMAFFIVLKAVLVAYGKAIIQGFKKNS